jgi:hypothetical protein
MDDGVLAEFRTADKSFASAFFEGAPSGNAALKICVPQRL